MTRTSRRVGSRCRVTPSYNRTQRSSTSRAASREQLVFNIESPPPAPPAPPPPANDDISGATAIPALPFGAQQDTAGATAAFTDPAGCFYSSQNSVWFAYTPMHNEALLGDTYNSSYFATVAVYTGRPGALSLVTCGDSTVPRTDVVAGQTYYFIVSTPYSRYPGMPMH